MSDIKLSLLYRNTWNYLNLCKKDLLSIELFVLNRNTWNHLTVSKKIAQACLKMSSTKCIYKSYIQYMHKKDLALNN